MLAQAISARAAVGSRDPDSLLGCLIYVEAGGTETDLASLMRTRSVSELLDKARAGMAGRVEAFKGDENRRQIIEFPDGILPLHWKRELVRLLLRPDGVSTAEILDLAAEHNVGTLGDSAGSTIRQLRDDLKPFSITIDTDKLDGANAWSFRIIGRSAWRMQKIIANGWAL